MCLCGTDPVPVRAVHSSRRKFLIRIQFKKATAIAAKSANRNTFRTLHLRARPERLLRWTLVPASNTICRMLMEIRNEPLNHRPFALRTDAWFAHIRLPYRIAANHGNVFLAWTQKRGRPLGLASTGKKAFVPNSFSNQVDSLPLRAGSYSTNSNLSFRLLIPDHFRCAKSHNEAIRSVTHLVLAHKLSRSFSVLSLSVFFILKASGSLSFLVFLAMDSAPIPLLRDQKTFSAGPCSFS